MKPVLKIDIVSDVVCPWCYIGKRRIEKAMATLHDEFDFDVNYLPFELNPQTPKEGFELKEYLVSKFGGEEKYNRLVTHITQVAAEEGLEFDFDKQRVSPNTKDAHRVIWLAKKEGKQLAVKEALLKAYFEQGVDLTKKENITTIASAVGLDATRVASFLDSPEGLQEVNQLEEINYQRGVTGVPFYIINNKYGISGAQSPEVFVQALKEIGTQVTTADGEVCDVDRENC